MIGSKTSVLIAGGGPCGLMLANELGRRGIPLILVDEKASTAFNPQANATQARTMEHFRRHGIADEIRGLGLPADYPTDIAYFTRYAEYELARFKLPSAAEARARVTGLSGSWSAAELPHRVSQKFVEAMLRRHAEKYACASINYGVRLVDFTDEGDRVRASVERIADGARFEIEADYLVAADGPRSQVRERLGFRYEGETATVRDFMGGRMYAIYLRAPDFHGVTGHAPAWMNVTFNRERRAFMAAVDGAGEFAFHTQFKPGENTRPSDAEALELFRAAVGRPIEAEILSHGSWLAGHALVADGFQKGRVFLGGDAVHLFTPTGGLGYNTAVEDAVNLGWKLAAVLKGQGGPKLLASYQTERQPLARRNTGYARTFADSLGLFEPSANIEVAGPEGDAERAEAGVYLEAHARAEFNIPGVTFGGRYDGSPLIASDGTSPPPDRANAYEPTACPGGRPPHLWLGPGDSLYDRFGFEWTLLSLGRDASAGEAIRVAAAEAGLDLTVVHLDSAEARDRYRAVLALIRPDQIVAWRGSDLDRDAARALVARVSGWVA